ncbi:MAG: hypothetical protein IJ174_06575 [Clostridia bacterium]|nr:hypothetical protein [Clostridia bacterium]
MEDRQDKTLARTRAAEQTDGISFETREETALTELEAPLPARMADPSALARARVHYEGLVSKYKKRQHDTLLDTVTTGLSYADEVAVDLGLMEDTGLLSETMDMVSTALPFAVIAVTEQAKVIMGKKTQKAALENTLYRVVKTGAAMGAGALAGTVGGFGAAIPAAIGVRALLDQHKSRALLGNRILGRTKRLSSLRERMNHRRGTHVPPPEEGQDKTE